MWLFINLPWVGISNRYSLEKLRLGFATLDGRLFVPRNLGSRPSDAALCVRRVYIM